jgi:Tol biopolymer transport system component
VWKVDANTGEPVRVWQSVARAIGGSVSPDGRTYTYVEFPPSGGPRVLERDLEAGTETLMVSLPASVSVAGPAWSPQHTRLAFATLDGNGWNLVLREADGALRHLTTDGAFNFAARWVDERHLVFARTAGKYLQVHRLDVDSGALERLSDATLRHHRPFAGASWGCSGEP